MRNIFLSALLLLLWSCQSESGSDAHDRQPTPEGMDFEIATEQSANYSSGKATGPHLLKYNNFRASVVLQELTEAPVELDLQEDPTITMEYNFPDKSRQAGREEAIAVILDQIGARQETVREQQTIYQLSISNDLLVDQSKTRDGVKFSQDKADFYAGAVTLQELVDRLNEETDIIFEAKGPANQCCLDLNFELFVQPERLAASMREAGMLVKAVEKRVNKVRYYSEG